MIAGKARMIADKVEMIAGELLLSQSRSVKIAGNAFSLADGSISAVRSMSNVAAVAYPPYFAYAFTPVEMRMKENPKYPNKIVTCGLLFSAQLFSYMIRFVLGVVAPTLMQVYDLSPKTMGYVLSGWNWSYTAGLPIMGFIVDRFGPYIVLGTGSLVWGLSTIALPIATSAVALFLMRLVFGFGQTPLIPAGALAVSRGFSVQERARVIAVAFAGNQVGLAIGATVAAFILATLGWQAVFYCIGGASLLLTLAWFGFYPDKRIGGLSGARPDSAHSDTALRTQWLSLFRFRSTWGIGFGQMGYLYAYFFFVSWLPGYLVLERKMTLLQSGIVSALPFWAGLLGTLSGGWLGDYLIQRGVSTTVSRKSIIGAGLSLSTVLVITAAYVEQSWLAVTLLTLCVGFLRLTTGSVNSFPIDLAPRFMVGALTGIQNFFGSIGGLLAPIVTGYMVNATGSFAGSFVVAGGMALFGAASYIWLVDNKPISR
jgi:MFS transporter, ACS family, D-galactonate transporter